VFPRREFESRIFRDSNHPKFEINSHGSRRNFQRPQFETRIVPSTGQIGRSAQTRGQQRTLFVGRCRWCAANGAPKISAKTTSADAGIIHTSGSNTGACNGQSARAMTGIPFAGRQVGRRGCVLVIATEGASEIPIRLRGVIGHKLQPAALAAGEKAGVQPSSENGPRAGTVCSGKSAGSITCGRPTIRTTWPSTRTDWTLSSVRVQFVQ
jgi:hypothetical protein